MNEQNSTRDSDLGVWNAGTQAAVDSARAADALLVSRLEALVGNDAAQEALLTGVFFQFAARMTRSCMEDAPARRQLTIDLREALRDNSSTGRYTLVTLDKLISEVPASTPALFAETEERNWAVQRREELACV